MRRILGILSALAAGFLATGAQASWFAIGDDSFGWGTAVCDTGSGSARCFGLRCNGNNPPPGAEWFLFADESGLPDAPIMIRLALARHREFRLTLSPVTLGGYLQHVAPLDLDAQSTFLDAVQRGHQIWISVEENTPFPLTLTGSRAGISHALSLCAPTGRGADTGMGADVKP